MEEYLYKKLRKSWRYLHPVNKLFTRIEYAVEIAARRFAVVKSRKSTLFVFTLGFIIYDILARIFLILTNSLPFQRNLFNFALDENTNNLFLFIDICLIFFILHFVTSTEPEKPRNRHWYE